MSVPLLLLLGALGIGMILHARYRQRQAADPDAAALAELAAEGGDLSQPLDLEFGFYFPAPDAAERVRRSLEAQGFSASVTPEGEANRWACLAVVTMIPDHSRLGKLRQELTALAAAERGWYVGWRVQGTEEESAGESDDA